MVDGSEDFTGVRAAVFKISVRKDILHSPYWSYLHNIQHCLSLYIALFLKCINIFTHYYPLTGNLLLRPLTPPPPSPPPPPPPLPCVPTFTQIIAGLRISQHIFLI